MASTKKKKTPAKKPAAKKASVAQKGGKKATSRLAKKPALKRAAPKKAAPKKAAAPKKPAKTPAETKRQRTIPSDALDRALAAAEVQGLMARLTPPLQPLVARLRSLFLESAPEAFEMLQHENPAYYAQGVFARIEPKDREVLVRFLRGSMLPSGDSLSGSGEDRVVSVSPEELKTDLLQKLVREAVALNFALVGRDVAAPKNGAQP
jgi:hypothetical protein